MKSPNPGLAGQMPLLYQLLTTKRIVTLAAGAIVFAMAAYGEWARLLLESEELITRFGKLIGGDFVVFRMAGTLTGSDQLVRMYDMGSFSATLRALYPGGGTMQVAWLYPPTMLIPLIPLAALPFVPGFIAWMTGSLAAFSGSFWYVMREGRALLFAMASPAVFQSVITGQTGLLTASLLGVAAFAAPNQPLLAGAAAGLLTVKPQLGLLLPLAYLAGRHHVAFAAAAGMSLALATASIFAFGWGAWSAFGDALRAHGMRLQDPGTGFPLGKLITPYGASRLLGSSVDFARLTQGVTTLALATIVVLVWRRVPSHDLRVATLLAATPLATPYAFYYELPILILPLALVVRQALAHGWLRLELPSVILAWIVAFLPPGSDRVPSVPVTFLVGLLAFGIVMRRVVPLLLRARERHAVEVLVQ